MQKILSKKYIFSFLCVCIFLFPAICQESTGKNSNEKDKNNKWNFFYIAPFDLFFNTLQLGYERKFRKNNSLAISAGFKLSAKEGKILRIGGNGEIQYRINLFYIKDNEKTPSFARDCSSFAYFAPFIQYTYEEITVNIYETAREGYNPVTIVNSVFGGAGFGLRLTGIDNRFTANAFVGGGLKLADSRGEKKYTEFFEAGYTGFAPKFAFQIGIAF